MINYDKELTLIQNYQMVYKFIENKKKNNFSTYVDKFSHEALDFLIKTLEVDQSKRIEEIKENEDLIKKAQVVTQ